MSQPPSSVLRIAVGVLRGGTSLCLRKHIHVAGCEELNHGRCCPGTRDRQCCFWQGVSHDPLISGTGRELHGSGGIRHSSGGCGLRQGVAGAGLAGGPSRPLLCHPEFSLTPNHPLAKEHGEGAASPPPGHSGAGFQHRCPETRAGHRRPSRLHYRPAHKTGPEHTQNPARTLCDIAYP